MLFTIVVSQRGAASFLAAAEMNRQLTSIFVSVCGHRRLRRLALAAHCALFHRDVRPRAIKRREGRRGRREAAKPRSQPLGSDRLSNARYARGKRRFIGCFETVKHTVNTPSL